MHRGADQKADQAARDQQSRLAALEAPRRRHIVNDIGRIERIVAVEQREQPHDQAKTQMKSAHPRLGQLLVHIDPVICHSLPPRIWIYALCEPPLIPRLD